MVVLAGFVGYVLLVHESDADRRENECKRHGVDATALAECRQSDAAKARVIEAEWTKALAFLAGRYNAALATFAQAPKSSVDEAGYTPTSVSDLSKEAGLSLVGAYVKADAVHPALGRKYKLRGIVHAYAPDKESSRTEMSFSVSEVGNRLAGVPLDIENLNRFERGFIKENCDSTVPGCTATLFATVGVLSTLGPLKQIGLIADRVDFEPAVK